MISIAWALLGVGCAPACGDLALLEQRECAVEAVIETLDATYPAGFIALKELDLEGLYADWRALPGVYGEPRAFGLALQRGVAGLQDGHTGLLGAHAPLRLNGVRAHLVEGEWIAAHTPLGVPDLRPGDAIRSIGGVPMDEAIAEATAFGSSEAGRARARVQGAFMPTQGTLVLVERGGVAQAADIIGALAPSPAGSGLAVVQGVHVLNIADFDAPGDLYYLDAWMDEVVEDAEALVLDLRGNGGGYAWVVEGLLGRLFEEAPADYPILGADGEPGALRGRVVSRGAIYTGPLAVLVDPGSASAANYVAHRVRREARGWVCGEPSGGGAGLPTIAVSLAPGLQLVSIDRYLVGPDGEDLELGVAPDPRCAMDWTRAQLTEGLDARHGDPGRDLALAMTLDMVRAP